MKAYKAAGRVWSAIVYIFLLLPLVAVIVTSFGEGNRAVFPIQGFTWKWYAEAIANQKFIESVFLSFRIAVVASVVSTILGVMVSLYFWKTSGRVKEIFELVIMFPMVVPTVVFGVAFLLMYSSFKVAAVWKIGLCHIALQIPYIVRSVTASLYNLDVGFEEASLVLGAGPLKTLFRVTLPCIKRGIISGVIFAFVVSFDEAVLIMFLRTSTTVTYPLRLYTHITEQFSPMISAFSTVFILLSLVIIFITEKLFGISNMYG